MKKILIVTRCMGEGGTEKVIFQLCRMIKENNAIPIVCAARGKGISVLNKENIKFYEIPDMKEKKLKVMVQILKTIFRIVKEEKISIIHTHHRMAAFYVRLLLPIIRVDFINNIHNTFDDKRFLTKFSYEKALNIAVGKTVKENMIRDYSLPEESIRVIYNAIDNTGVEIYEDEIIQKYRKDGYFIVGNIGRINTQKGLEYYIKSISDLKVKGLKIKFFIIGDGVLRKEMEMLVSKLNLTEDVIFYGFSDNVLNIIRQLDIVVLTSLWEGFPLTPIETFSMGKTIVATDVPGTMEIVKDDENGIIVPKKNSEALTNAIEELYSKKEKRRQLEQNAKKTYDEKFSYQAFCEQYKQVYGFQ